MISDFVSFFLSFLAPIWFDPRGPCTCQGSHELYFESLMTLFNLLRQELSHQSTSTQVRVGTTLLAQDWPIILSGNCFQVVTN